MTKEFYELEHWVADVWAEKLAWKRAGFKSFDDVKQKVKDLPIEEKIELLTELNIDEMARKYFTKKNEFLRKLGQKTWIEREEILDHIKDTYKGDSRTEWIIHEDIFNGGKWINPFTARFDTVYAERIEKLLKDDKNE